MAKAITTFRAIFDTIPEGVVFADSDNRLAYINPAAERIRRIEGEKYIGLNLLSIHSPRLQMKIADLLSAFRRGEQASHRNTVELRGERFENSYHAVRDPDGKYLGALMVSRHIPRTSG